jgi:pyruvate/2-oxoacid:ferredoxin oxidoreductase alpha subunit
MTYFSDAARQLPIRFEQAEDEIAAINLAIEALQDCAPWSQHRQEGSPLCRNQ